MSVLNKIFCFLIVLAATTGLQAQAPKSPLSRIINVPSTVQIAPSLSGDGQQMIFTTSANLTGEMLVYYSYQSASGNWSQPQPIEVINRSHKINHLGGYSLSYDGQTIFFTSRKTYGIGKYDIWYSQKIGNNWSAPRNLGKPVNSPGNEGCPSLSADGQFLYFVRCETMDQNEGSGCVLMMSQKRNKDRWSEAVALPGHINDGNILSPTILADGETLIYAKGHGDNLDLYQTRKTGQGWSKPQALDYVNTSDEERFVSVPGKGDILYYSARFQGGYDIIKAKIPENMQPRKIVWLTGEVADKDQGQPIEAFIQVYDLESKEQKQFYRTTDKNGSFQFFIPGGRVYDFSVVPLDQRHTFYSEIMDLRELDSSSKQTLRVNLESLSPHVTFQLNSLRFASDSTLDDLSGFEMSRLFKLLKSNPKTQIEIAVHRDSWEIDSTLLAADTFFMAVADTLFMSTADTIGVVDSTLLFQEPPPDPTEIRALAIVRYLIERGVPEHLLVPRGYADTQPIAPNDREENRILNRRVEIRIL